jgi:predicted nucleic acid-binding protein
LITLDSSALYALTDRHDRSHAQLKRALSADGGPYLIPAAILAEIGYMIESRLGTNALLAFVGDLDAGYVVHHSSTGWARMAKLVKRYADLPLGFADAAVVECAERHGGRVMTLDGHFAIVAREGRIAVLPE